jgi:hypothetical protein
MKIDNFVETENCGHIIVESGYNDYVGLDCEDSIGNGCYLLLSKSEAEQLITLVQGKLAKESLNDLIDNISVEEPNEMRIIKEGFNIDLKKYESK